MAFVSQIRAIRFRPVVRTSLSFLILPTAILLATVQVSVSEESRIDKARGKYDATLEKIEKEHANHMRTWPARYVKKLMRLQAKIKEHGELEAWEQVDQEIARYKEDRSLTEGDVSAGSGYLERVQQEYIGLRSKYDVTKHRSIIKLRDSYVLLLNKMQKSSTREGNIDAAHEAKEEIVRVNDSEEVTSAEFAIAHASVIDAEAKKEPDVEDKKEEPRQKYPAGESTEGVEIHAAGKIPPKQDGAHFKRQSLTRTEKSPLGTKVAVTLMESNQIKKTGQSRSRGRYWSESTSTSTKSDYRSIRLGVRTSGSDKPIEDLFLHIQHFSKPFGQGGNDDPSQFADASAHLPAIEKLKLHVDFPPVSLTKQSTSTTTSRYYSYYYYGGNRARSSRAGQKYYGCIVSVFERDGTLLYQGYSAKGLKNYASSEMPRM